MHFCQRSKFQFAVKFRRYGTPRVSPGSRRPRQTQTYSRASREPPPSHPLYHCKNPGRTPCHVAGPAIPSKCSICRNLITRRARPRLGLANGPSSRFYKILALVLICSCVCLLDVKSSPPAPISPFQFQPLLPTYLEPFLAPSTVHLYCRPSYSSSQLSALPVCHTFQPAVLSWFPTTSLSSLPPLRWRVPFRLAPRLSQSTVPPPQTPPN